MTDTPNLQRWLDDTIALDQYRKSTKTALDLLEDARHAATHDRPAIADELIDRAMGYITTARDVHTAVISNHS